MNITEVRNCLGDPVKINITEESEEALTKKLRQLCEETANKIKEMVDIYDKNDILEQIQPEEFYSLIPKQFNKELALFAEGFNIAGKAWEKASSEDLEVEQPSEVE